MVKHADLLICDSENIESYIHDELMNYSKDYINMKENGIKTESFSILH